MFQGNGKRGGEGKFSLEKGADDSYGHGEKISKHLAALLFTCNKTSGQARGNIC